jgi:deoxyribose-phosphate aldolase
LFVAEFPNPVRSDFTVYHYRTSSIFILHTRSKSTMARPTSISVSLLDLSKMIDHSLLHPTMTDDTVSDGLKICKKYNVATACVKPYHIPFARKLLEGTDVLVCPVIGFPHGNSTSEVKVFEAVRAVEEGGKEIDMVVNIGRVLSGKWEYVKHEIRLINEAVVGRGAVLKVIFENDCEFDLPIPFSSSVSRAEL